MNIKSYNQSCEIVVYKLFLTILNFEKVLFGVILETGNVHAIFNAKYKVGNMAQTRSDGDRVFEALNKINFESYNFY
jgi:hypothetical protein